MKNNVISSIVDRGLVLGINCMEVATETVQQFEMRLAARDAKEDRSWFKSRSEKYRASSPQFGVLHKQSVNRGK